MRTVDVDGGVADRHRDTLLAQPFDISAVGHVRSGDRVDEIAQHLGNPAHADPADPNEMNWADILRQFQLHVGPVSLSVRFAMRMTNSASRSAASIAPIDFAPCAIGASRAGAAASAVISAARRSGVNALWSMRIAPPIFSSALAL